MLRTAFWVGTTISLAGMVVGLLYSIQRERTLPRLQLAYYPGIERLVDSGDYRQALDQLGVAIHLDFLSRVRIYQEIAQIAMQAGELDDHIRACNALVEVGAANEVVRLNLASSLVIRGASGDHLQAEELSRDLLQKFPGHPAVNCNLGAALLGQDRVDEAEKYFVRSLELKPGLLPAQAGLAKIRQVRESHE